MLNCIHEKKRNFIVVIHPASQEQSLKSRRPVYFLHMTLIKQPAWFSVNIMLSILYTSKHLEQKIQSPDQSVARALL